MHPYICHNHNYIILFFFVNVYTSRALDWWMNTLYTCICLIKINLHIMVLIIILSYLCRYKRINQAYSFFSYQIHVKLSLVSQCMLLTTSITVHKTIPCTRNHRIGIFIFRESFTTVNKFTFLGYSFTYLHNFKKNLCRCVNVLLVVERSKSRFTSWGGGHGEDKYVCERI